MEIREKERNDKLGKIVWELSAGKEEIGKGIDKSYHEAQKYAQIPGFRKGKVPRRILEAKVGKDYFFDEVKKELVEQGLKELSEKKIQHLAEDLNIVTATTDEIKFEIITYDVPQITALDYKHIKADRERVNVADSVVEDTIETMRKRMAVVKNIDDRPAENGDIAVIDFEGFVDGKKFSGGSGNNSQVKLGSHQMLPELESGIVGMKPTESREIPVTFPADYKAKKLAGQPAVFKVTLRELKQEVLPEKDNELAKDLNYGSMDEMRQKVRERYQQMKTEEVDSAAASTIIKTIAERIRIEAPRLLVEEEIDRLVEVFEENVKHSYRDFKLDSYLKETKQELEKFRENYKVQAENNVKGQLVIQGVIRAENVTISEEELKEKAKKVVQGMGLSEEYAEKYFQNKKQRNALESDLKVERAIRILIDSADITEVDKLPETEKEAEA
ncbi:MAG: trigger factor [Candidatus Wallbacteria bacterium]|nr:trigger factor [Candidatus Wallbacteria bacterium]